MKKEKKIYQGNNELKESRVIWSVSAFAALGLVAACASWSTMDGENPWDHVKISEHAPEGCDHMGEIHGDSSERFRLSMSEKDYEKRAEEALRIKANELGADTVELMDEEKKLRAPASPNMGRHKTDGMIKHGVAYRCHDE